MPEEMSELQLLQHQLNQQLLDGYTKLAHKHASVSYALITVLVLVLGAAGLGGYYGLKSYQTAITHAEQVEQNSQAVIESYRQQLAQDTAERARLESEIAARDKAAQKKKQQVADITDPLKAIVALQAAYPGRNVAATVTPDGKVAFPVPSVNQFTQTKIDADAMAADINDLNAQVTSLKGDLSQGQNALKACQGTVAAYKKAAKKSRWSKVVSGMKIGAAIAIAGFLGHAI